MDYKLTLTNSETELLLYFEHFPSLELLSAKLGRDVTVISRQLKRISEKVDVLTKTAGRWCLTEKGKRFNQASQDYIRAQKSVVAEKYLLRIGTNREFAARCLGPQIHSLQRQIPNAILEIRSYEKGTELALLSGEIDIGFDCGRPYSPEIKYHQVQNEVILAVASPTFMKEQKKINTLNDLFAKPHIYCERLRPDRIANVPWDAANIAFHTNDIATARAIAVNGLGWALLPKYAILIELINNELKSLFKKSFGNEKYGVWTLRNRTHLAQDFSIACQWLSKLDF